MSESIVSKEVMRDPQNFIHLFNTTWIQWMTSLQKQLPELHDEFDTILNKLYAARENDCNYLMFAFQQYTAPYIQLIKQRDTAYFDILCDISQRQGIPPGFKAQFQHLTTKQQDQIWVTLDTLVRFVCKVYPAYKEEVERVMRC
jgi:hypothetical protein